MNANHALKQIYIASAFLAALAVFAGQAMAQPTIDCVANGIHLKPVPVTQAYSEFDANAVSKYSARISSKQKLIVHLINYNKKTAMLVDLVDINTQQVVAHRAFQLSNKPQKADYLVASDLSLSCGPRQSRETVAGK